MMEYSGRTTAHAHKFDDWATKTIEKPKEALTKRWFFDVQWSNCPVEVEQVVKWLWRDYDLGNDHYFLKLSIDDIVGMEEEGPVADVWYWGETEEERRGWVEEPVSYQPLIDYLRSKDLSEDEEIIIHWWW